MLAALFSLTFCALVATHSPLHILFLTISRPVGLPLLSIISAFHRCLLVDHMISFCRLGQSAPLWSHCGSEAERLLITNS